MSSELIIAITFVLLLLLIFLKCPIFVSLGISGIFGIYLERGMMGLSLVPISIMSQLFNFTLVAIPLFVLMGDVISTTGIGRDLYDAGHKWFNRIPGGLAIASIMAAAVFGAMCGVSIAGVAVIGAMAIPQMLRHNYDKSLAAGAVTASGALAMLIPPSLPFILYGSVSKVSVGKLFIGGIIPGIILAVLMSLYVVVLAVRNPSLAPGSSEKVGWKERILSLKNLWPALILMALVIGVIYTGVCTPTEAAAVGALGSLFIAHFVYKSINWQSLKRIFASSSRITGSILIIAACAFIFSQFLVFTKVPDMLCEFILSLGWPPFLVLFVIMVLLVVMGCFIDGVSLVLVTTPILLPAITALGIDPLWYGILLVMNLEIAVITPPVGLNLYTLKSVIPELDLGTIIKGTLPYVFIEFACILLFMLFPKLVMWLPGFMK